MESKIPLYEKLANDIINRLEKGLYKPGDKIPSIRKFSHNKKVSINTVKEAYKLLEFKRIIEVRPQSGYYIRYQWPNPPKEIHFNNNEINPFQANTSDLFHMVHQNLTNRNLIQLGIIEMNNSILPVKRLNQMMVSQLRYHEDISISTIFHDGLDRLRIQIAKRYNDLGCSIGLEDVYITSGCMTGILISLLILCKPGDTIAVEAPYFPSVLQIGEQLGLKMIGVPANPETGISLETFEFILQNYKINACVFVLNFNNPLGSVLSTEKKIELLKLVSSYDIPIIEDDIYGDLVHNTNERPDVLKTHDQTGNVILCSSFTKTVAPGYRIGWIIPGKYHEKIRRFKISMCDAGSTPTQLALAAIMEDGYYDRYLNKIRRIYAANMANMAECIGRHFPEGTRVTHPKGGFILWVQMPEDVDSLKLYSMAIKNGITFMPGPIFSPLEKFRNCIRLNCANWSTEIENAIKTLGRLVRD